MLLLLITFLKITSQRSIRTLYLFNASYESLIYLPQLLEFILQLFYYGSKLVVLTDLLLKSCLHLCSLNISLSCSSIIT